MIGALRLALGLLLASIPVAASAQAVTDIRIGQTLSKKAGTRTDLYRFVGGSGTTIKATLTTPGKAALILYTPAGEEMLTAQGNGSVTLEAILPLWDVFFIGVVRQNGTQSHSLKLTGIDPDLHLAMFALDTGFAVTVKRNDQPYVITSCWIEPGIKQRATFPNYVSEVTIGRGGKEYWFTTRQDGRTLTSERSVRLDGANLVRTSPSGKAEIIPLESLFATRPASSFGGYLCDPK